MKLTYHIALPYKLDALDTFPRSSLFSQKYQERILPVFGLPKDVEIAEKSSLLIQILDEFSSKEENIQKAILIMNEDDISGIDSDVVVEAYYEFYDGAQCHVDKEEKLLFTTKEQDDFLLVLLNNIISN